MSRFRSNSVFETSAGRLAAGLLAAALVSPVPALAFFQQTRLEGSVGADLGGVWMSVHHLMPEFRISLSKPASPGLPLVVGPIPAELASIAGKEGSGVVVTACGDGSFCSENGIVPTDIIVKIGATEIASVDDYNKAVTDLPPSVLLSIRRPALQVTTVRLLKIQYKAEGKEEAGASTGDEALDLKVLDVQLPFAEALEATRQSHVPFEPSAADVAALAKGWAELPGNQPEHLMNGNYRFVSKDSFDEALASDTSLVNAKYAVVLDIDDNPVKGNTGKLIDIYGIESADSKAIEGSYVSVAMASAPFPINIEFKGRFRMQRLADWSDRDDKVRAERAAKKAPKEDLSKYKTLPDVPPAAKPAAKTK